MTATVDPASPPTVADPAGLARAVDGWRAEGRRVALVATMGALHEGHLTLVRRAFERADRVVVSVFVNPKQFGPREDFGAYPRRLAADAALLRGEGVDLLYAPDAAAMYPDGFATTVSVGRVTEGLCAARRPGHFDGVTTVVTKLLLQSRADVSLFGEKDYQQLLTIRRLVADLDIPCAVVGVPTVREADGLALASRNGYLTAEERARAPALHATLRAVVDRLVRDDGPADGVLARARDGLRSSGFAPVDYLELRAADLGPHDPAREGRLLAAAFLGATRLIDNVPVPVIRR